MAVTHEVFTDKANAGRAGRSNAKRPTSSAIKNIKSLRGDGNRALVHVFRVRVPIIEPQLLIRSEVEVLESHPGVDADR